MEGVGHMFNVISINNKYLNLCIHFLATWRQQKRVGKTS